MYWNTMVVFMVSGLWHGANWTFIIWGAYHGVLVCLYKAMRKAAKPRSKAASGVQERQSRVQSSKAISQ
jgi:D-alanyl-lipoteichoic acid acyltransferase DltB (MBOAT superfamily)